MAPQFAGTLFDVPIPGKGFMLRKAAVKVAMKDPAAFSREVRGAVLQAKRAKTAEITNAIDDFTTKNPNVTVDISDDINTLKRILTDPETPAPDLQRLIGSIVRKSKNQTLKNLIDNPELARTVNMRQLQDLKNSIEYFPSIQSKLSKGAWDKVTLGEQDLLNLVDDIKVTQTGVVPRLKDAREAYAAFMDDYKAMRPLLSEKVLEKQLRSDFANQTSETVERIARTLPQNLRGQVTAFSKAVTGQENTKRFLINALKTLATFVAGGMVYKGIRDIGKWGGQGDN
jgi:hypothetical protein